MSKNATIRATVLVNDESTVGFGSAAQWTAALDYNQAFGEGTTAGNYDIAYLDERSVASGANDDVDLAGVLTDAFGVTIAAAEIVALMIMNKPAGGAANTTDLTIGAGSNPFTGFLGGTTPTVGPLKPGAMFMMSTADAAGLGAVTAGTGDILRVANSAGATAKYQIAILARTA